MKKFYYLFSILLIPVILIIQAYSSGSPGGKTGSVGDNGTTCTQCHSGSATSVDGWITTDIPDDLWEPGQTYTITATGSHSGVSSFGFELTAENESGQKVGSFVITNPSETKLAPGNTAVTHTSGGTTPSGDAKTWTFDWTAPETNEGDITFYAAFNAANGNGGTSGDVIYTSMSSYEQSSVGIYDETISDAVMVYPNPAVNVINIDFPESMSNNSTGLYNVSGKLVLRFKSETNTKIDVSGLNRGLYFFSFELDGKNIVKKFFKQ